MTLEYVWSTAVHAGYPTLIVDGRDLEEKSPQDLLSPSFITGNCVLMTEDMEVYQESVGVCFSFEHPGVVSV